MLRTDFRFPTERGPRRWLAALLGEAFMGFLAIVSVGLTLFPMLFDLPPRADATIDALQWALIGWFGVEYAVALASARARGAFVADPWRLLDLATVLIPLATLLPGVSDALRSTPVLRLVRLVRLLTLGVRVSGVAIRRRGADTELAATKAAVQVTLMADAPEFAPAAAPWAELLRWLRAPGREWYHVASPSREQLTEIGAACGAPAGFLESHLLGSSYPHVAASGAFAAVFLWLPEMTATGQVERQGMLFVLKGDSLLSLARRPVHAVERIAAPALEDGADKLPFAIGLLGHVLRRAIAQNETLVGHFEHELRLLEEVPIRESSPAFFERTFRLKKELAALQADLWRLKGVLADLAERRVPLPAAGEEASAIFRRLTTDAEYLYETVINLRDEAISVLELHLNIVSFDMNRVMRVLAVVSVLGLIPAVIGGLFGMNLADNPWPFTLPQVAFGVCFGMVLCLYLFFVKGWLR